MGKKNRTDEPNVHLNELKGLLLFTLGVILFLSLISFAIHGKENLLGRLGHFLGLLLHHTFGITSYALAFALTIIGIRMVLVKPQEDLRNKLLFCLLGAFSLGMLLEVASDSFPNFHTVSNSIFYPWWAKKSVLYALGGRPVHGIYREIPFVNLHDMVNATGVVLFFSVTLLASTIYLLKMPVRELIALWRKVYGLFGRKKQEEPAKEEEDEPHHLRFVNLSIPPVVKEEPPKLPKQVSLPAETVLKIKTPKPTPKPKNIPNDFELPSLNLLTNPKPIDQNNIKKDLKKQAEVLEQTLLSFGIEAKVGQINCGPTITSFEVHPAVGVKVQKIKTLENDIALNMEAKSIRIIAPIPGKAAVGIEVPNPFPLEVGFKEILAAYKQSGKKFKIPILLGKAVNGDYVMNDLTKMPHCIIAGATGSGKSVCINTIIMAIIYSLRPDEVKFLMIDPKKVELTPYSKLPHMISPVITESGGAQTALIWLVNEMEKRYEILKQLGVRNIEAFNQRKRDKDFENSLSIEVPEKLPYIVGIIDELADLMMVSAHEIETPIARIAQMARAVGIHMILATQRPSREVITGLIKANFPTRISFKVASRVNSQIVIDEVGAETLLGNGDMLFLPPGTSQLIRAQGAFIRDEDITRVVQDICARHPTHYAIPSFETMELGDLSDKEPPQKNSLLREAVKHLQQNQNISTTFLQRKLNIGYPRAASLMDLLEEEGYVSAPDSNKVRKVLRKDEED